ncbi:MAG: rhomboid family intramembrane serine protease [Blautia sp.]|nr:rhomboid family intramembrane serine protease [Blautia sp.]MCM1199923.1 rhomboid family intramembrane serine protease [Bacteroides fragilis]
MVYGQLDNLLTEQGFCKVPSNLPEFSFFFRRESAYVNVLHVIDYKPNLYITEDQYAHVKGKILEFFREKGFDEVHILSLLIGEDTEKAKRLCGNDAFCWLIDSVRNRLMIHENQVADFYGMKGVLEKFLDEISAAPPMGTNDAYEPEPVPEPVGFMESVKGQMRSFGGNILLVAANVILFILCTFTGELVYNIGGFSVMDLIQGGGWYRMVSSMFLHADIGHLVSNMLILYYIGNAVEKKTGHLPYLILYFMSGIAGNVFSAGYELFTGYYISSIGASGAIFGVEGALLMLALVHRGKFAEATTGRIVFSIAFSLYCGFTSRNVDNAAHIGGLLMGFLLAGIFWLFTPGSRKERMR